MERTLRSVATDATRKRKRGALQDISNNAKKLSHPRGSSRGGVGVIKKRVENDESKSQALRASARGKTTATTVNSALKSSMASTVSSKAKKCKPVGKKTETTRVKKRKLEGVENQPPVPHQKVQTSMLSFQASSKPSERKENEVMKKEQVSVDAEVELAVIGDQELVEKKTSAEAVEVVSEEKKNDTSKAQESEELKAEVAARKNEYFPRPYTCAFDHKDSCFDVETYTASVRDVDAPSATISSHHAKLIRELDTYYRKHEIKYLPEADYIGTVQMDINEKMRTILIDWLVEVCEEYELDSQTFHKAVNLVDRCLKKIKINRKQFQLLGCACMMIAAKFEEVFGPNVEEFVYISDQTYTAVEMLNMEVQVLNALQYRVASTTCYGFIHRYTEAGCTTDKQRSLVLYLCDFALLFLHMVRFKPSILVASAVYLARLTTGVSDPWTPTLHHATKYNPLDFQECVEELHRLHAIENQVVITQRDKAKAVSEKYLVDKFHKASTIPACSKSQLADSLDLYTPFEAGKDKSS
ncbi:cyclin-like protein [Plasmopara halstedii]|uniref:Cyclin-like protein n=1 Tax=Plasmopara halstedii TaxID=4781 RepID=A0A0P1B6U2_PLAHL|nr:cyclin-like protein [Plasmopara halstedii]CEG50050.1 cyclin-like protein [Plasmopara halstedii]|eukprot:XP_024586419.1 cyclin-like protein [Plasmopara halstedii]